MRCLYILLAVVCTCLLGCSASPVDPNRRRVQRPIPRDLFTKGHEPDEIPQGIFMKGYELDDIPRGIFTEGNEPDEIPDYRRSLSEDVEPYAFTEYPGGPKRQRLLRKGEYYCGDKICKLKPGEIPAGCNGMCQYPVL